MRAKGFFFDRDGVLNQAIVRDGRPYPPNSVSQVCIVEGAQATLRELKKLGFMIFVVTNQPDVARGVTSKKDVSLINEYLLKWLPIDEIVVCAHDDIDLCDCRKPKPGMILGLSKKHDIDLKSSFLVGDRWRDILAGERAGCKTIFLDYGYREKPPDRFDYRIFKLRDILSLTQDE